MGKPPDQVTAAEAFGHAHGAGPFGKKPSSVTIGARIACLSSFYRFLIRMSLVSANPCDQLECPKATQAPPKGLTAADIKKLLEAIPSNPVGLRDRAIILTLTLTGRRRAEVLNLKADGVTTIHALVRREVKECCRHYDLSVSFSITRRAYAMFFSTERG